MTTDGYAGYITESAVTELLCDMLRFDTTNPPGNEKPLAEMLAALLRSRGFSCVVDDFGDNRGNVTARLSGSGERHALLLNGHLDVVPVGQAAWRHSPFSPAVKNGRVYGRGAADMKGGLAAMIVAAMAVQAAGLPLKGDLVIAGSADEESGSLGARHFAANGGLDGVGAVIVGEPSACGVNVAEKGALWLEITATGKTAHGAFPAEGVNAVAGMNAVVSSLLQLRLRHRANELLGGPSVNVATIRGGVKTNVVPDSCVLTVDIRTVPGMSHDSIVSDVAALCKDVAATVPGLEFSVKAVNDRPPVETFVDHPFVKMAQAVIREKFSRDAEPKGVAFYTDAAIFLPKTNLPAILYGPGDPAMAHQPDEFVPVDALVEAAHFYAGMIERYLVD